MSLEIGERPIIYIGEDERYRTRLIQRFNDVYSDLNLNFPEIDYDKIRNEHGVQALLSKLIKFNPGIVYFDISSRDEDMLYLVELISRDPFFQLIPICGLVDNHENAGPYFKIGGILIFIKGIDLSDAVNTPMVMAFSDQAKAPDFAKAKVTHEASLIDDVRVCFLSESITHVESNLPLNVGDEIELVSEIPKKNVRSQKFIVKNSEDKDLYYDFPYGHDLEYLFIDPPDIEPNATRYESKNLSDQHALDVQWCQKKHKEWVAHNVGNKVEKGLKILMIDQSMRVLNDKETGDIRKSDFGLRFQSCFSDGLHELSKMRPIIIGYQFLGQYGENQQSLVSKAVELSKKQKDGEGKSADEEKYRELLLSLSTAVKKDLEVITMLTKKIKSILGYRPIVALFGNHFFAEKSLQDSLSYPLISSHSSSLKLSVLTKVANQIKIKKKEKATKIIEARVSALKKSDPEKYVNLTKENFEEKRYYIKSFNSLGHGEIAQSVTVYAISESEIYFASKYELAHTTYRMNYPIDIALHIVSIDDNPSYKGEENSFHYRSLIHCVSETDKQKLREQVNKIFFSDLNAERESEREAFKELNKIAEKSLKK